MKLKVIGLTGYARSGKDTAVSFLVEKGFVRVSFADALREAALALDPIIPLEFEASGSVSPFTACMRLSELVAGEGWERAKEFSEVRRTLQRIGTEAGRDIHGIDCWVNIAADKASRALEAGKSVAFSDVRFSNELAAIVRLAGWYDAECSIYRISRKGVGPINNHSSDIIDLKWDGEIHNDSDIETFRQQVLAL